MIQEEETTITSRHGSAAVAAQGDLRMQTFQTLFKEIGPASYAAVVGVLYVSGFLVLNSNLAKWGVTDIEFIDARYFLASASFAFYLVCFYLFAGRAALLTPKWLGEDLERINRGGQAPAWSFVAFIHSNITALFGGCLSAALFTLFAIGGTETATAQTPQQSASKDAPKSKPVPTM